MQIYHIYIIMIGQTTYEQLCAYYEKHLINPYYRGFLAYFRWFVFSPIPQSRLQLDSEIHEGMNDYGDKIKPSIINKVLQSQISHSLSAAAVGDTRQHSSSGQKLMYQSPNLDQLYESNSLEVGKNDLANASNAPLQQEQNNPPYEVVDRKSPIKNIFAQEEYDSHERANRKQPEIQIELKAVQSDLFKQPKLEAIDLNDISMQQPSLTLEDTESDLIINRQGNFTSATQRY